MILRRTISRLIYSQTVQRTTAGYRFALKRRYGVVAPRGLPDAPWTNSVLRSARAIEAASLQVTRLGLPSHPTPAKNWDSLAMLAAILAHSPRPATVLDAGSAATSVILPWLFLYGYRQLFGLNIEFERAWRAGPIRYEPGDVTNTRFQPGTFDAVVCQSVLEHGVDVAAYFKETSRILRPGGLLLTSIDYWVEPIDTPNLVAGGRPFRVFSKADTASLLDLAEASGLTLTGPLDLVCEQPVILYAGCAYTFLIIALSKRDR